VPVWAAVIIGLGSGLIGTVVSTLLRISHESEFELRRRMINAADAFAVEVMNVVPIVSAAIDEREQGETSEYGQSETFAAAVQAVEELSKPVARVQLLFGMDAEASRAAVSVASALGTALGAVEEWPPEPPDVEPDPEDDPDDDAYWEEAEELRENEIEEARRFVGWGGEAFDTFKHAASRDIRSGKWTLRRPGFLRRKTVAVTPQRTR
jgi:hypothetical protein